MSTELLQTHFDAAQMLLEEGEFVAASREAELAVDEFWKDGSPEIAKALPLLALLNQVNDVDVDIFQSLEDLPVSLSESLVAESSRLHDQYQSDASLEMMNCVNTFVQRWATVEKPPGDLEVEPEFAEPEFAETDFIKPSDVAESDQPSEPELDEIIALDEITALDEATDIVPSSETNTLQELKPVVDEKVSLLRAQIVELYALGKRDLAVETSLELANEYASRGKKRRAFKLFRQVVEKSKRPRRTELRINGLLDFARFMSGNGKLADAERLLRLAAGVAKKTQDKNKFAAVLGSLGVVLMHQSKNDSAQKYLQKASLLLNEIGIESDVVHEHLDALVHDAPCGCSEAPVDPSVDHSFADADWA